MNGMSPISFHSTSSRYSRGGSLRRGHDGTHPASLETKFLRDFTCCSKVFPTLHELTEHYEDFHTTLSSEIGLAERRMVGANVPPAKRSSEAVFGLQSETKTSPDSETASGQTVVTDCVHELPIFGDCDLDSDEHSGLGNFHDEVANKDTAKKSNDVSIWPMWKMRMQHEMLRSHASVSDKIGMGGSQWMDRYGWIVRRGSQVETHNFTDEELLKTLAEPE